MVVLEIDLGCQHFGKSVYCKLRRRILHLGCLGSAVLVLSIIKPVMFFDEDKPFLVMIIPEVLVSALVKNHAFTVIHYRFSLESVYTEVLCSFLVNAIEDGAEG